MVKLFAILFFLLPIQNLIAQKSQVFFTLDTECPMSQNYTTTIKKLQKDFPEVQFTALFTPWDSDSTIAQFNADYALNLPYKIDKNYDFLKKMDAKVVPEVFFFNEKDVLMYRGAIDDWYYELGKYRQNPTVHFLQNAITAYLAGECIAVEKTDALGCILEY